MITGTNWIPKQRVTISISPTDIISDIVPLGRVTVGKKGTFTLTVRYRGIIGPQPYIIAASSTDTVMVYLKIIIVPPAPLEPMPIKRRSWRSWVE
jgi:hypothetical protein